MENPVRCVLLAECKMEDKEKCPSLADCKLIERGPADAMEAILVKAMNNTELVTPMLEVLEKLKSAGLIELMHTIINDYIPTDVDFLGRFFSSKEFTVSLLKTMNVLISVMGAMSSEKTSDLIKAIMFNFENITSMMIDSASNPKKYSPLKITRLLTDEDIMTGFAALIAFLKGFGQIMRRAHP